MKKIVSVILILMLVFAAVPSYAANNVPTLTAESALLLDMTTGKILYEKNSHAKRYPASTAKMLTCILALENLDMNDNITVDGDVIKGITGNSLNLKAGEVMGTGLLVSGMMVCSGNDAAMVVADEVAGSVEKFAEMMNAKAAEIGCTESHFTNPHGLHDDNMYTTAYDLSLIARYCMKNEVFRRIVSRGTFTIPETNKSQIRYLSNTNLLLHDETAADRVYVNNILRYAKYEGCIGIKTGNTSKAGGCLVSAATRQGTTLLSVVMLSGATERFSDSIALLDWGFENYKTIRALDSGYDAGMIKVKKGKINNVGTVVNDIAYVTVPVEASSELLSTNVVLDENVTAPFDAGTKVGTLQIFAADQLVGEYDVVTKDGVEQGGILRIIGISNQTAKKIGVILLIIILLLAALFAAYVVIERKKAAKRRAARAKRKEEERKRDAELRAEWEKTYHNRYR